MQHVYNLCRPAPLASPAVILGGPESTDSLTGSTVVITHACMT